MKNYLFILFALLIVIGCEKQSDDLIQENTTNANLQAPPTNKVAVCHYNASSNTYSIMLVNPNALNGHLNHGDSLIIDVDGDGYTASEVVCIAGGDCDDNDPMVNPGMTEIPCNGIDDDCDLSTPDGIGEICDNGIDDDCDGLIDGLDPDCAFCVTPGLLTVTLPDGSTLYVHPEDQRTGTPLSNGVIWGQNGVDIAGLENYATKITALQDLNGEANTTAIVSQLTDYNGGDYAAKVCADLVYQGCDDWYLPSLGELNAILAQLGPLGNNNLNGTKYWSSTENFDSAAWAYANQGIFGSGFFGITKEDSSGSCRCVRKQ